MDKYAFELTNLKLTKGPAESEKRAFFSNNPLTLDQANDTMLLIKYVLNSLGGNLNRPNEGKLSMNWWDGKVILEKIPVQPASDQVSNEFDQDPFDDDEED